MDGMGTIKKPESHSVREKEKVQSKSPRWSFRKAERRNGGGGGGSGFKGMIVWDEETL